MKFGLACALLVLPVTSLAAHHSFAAYDMRQKLVVAGTIKEFRWGAPHLGMVLAYMDGKRPSTMRLVSGSPTAFARQGFKSSDFPPGTKITVTYHPNRNGAPGGAMAEFKLADGRAYRDAETFGSTPIPPAPPAR